MEEDGFFVSSKTEVCCDVECLFLRYYCLHLLMLNIYVIPVADQSVAIIFLPMTWRNMQASVERGNRILAQFSQYKNVKIS